MGYEEEMDNLEEYPMEIRIRILAAQVKASANLGTWLFINDGSVFFSTCVHEKEFLSFFKLGKCFEFLCKDDGKWDRPVILSDHLGMVWLAENAFAISGEATEKKNHMLVVIGPLFLGSSSIKRIEDNLKSSGFSIQMQRQMMRTLTEVPVISMSAVYQYAKTLHHTLTSRNIQTSDFIYQNKETRMLMEGAGNAIASSARSVDRSIQVEKQILQAVRDGNLDYRQILEQASGYWTGAVSDTGDSLRDGKNSVIILTALVSRAAMDGGLAVSTSKEMELSYIREAEDCGTVTEVKIVMDRMLDDFVHKVRECTANPLISRVVQESCDYIRANILKPLTVEEIAKAMGYTTYYFTKKFYKEMGIKVTDYIKESKVYYAKAALLTTKKSIEEISESLHFGSRNYFSKVFRSIVGVTPAVYRESVGKEFPDLSKKRRAADTV